MTNKNRKLTLGIAGGVILIALAVPKLINLNPADGNNAAGMRSQTMDVRTYIVQPEMLGGTVTVVGTVLSTEEVEVRSQVSGQIEHIGFREGSHVNKGDLLVKINDDELQAQLLRAESRLAIAEQQFERQKQLFEKNLTSEQEFNNAQNELNIAKAEGMLIKAQIAKTEIRAPFAGTIGLRFVSEGSTVTPATVITRLQDNSRMKVDFTIPEKYINVVRVGTPITFRVQSNATEFQGRVYSLDSRINEATRTLRLRALAPNPRGALLPGSFATINVLLNQRQTLTIPTYALIPDLKGHKVFVVRNGKAMQQVVTIGARTDQRVEIISGLQSGDTLITSGLLQLRVGAAVRPLAATTEPRQ